jgi:hypothetical protein
MLRRSVGCAIHLKFLLPGLVAAIPSISGITKENLEVLLSLLLELSETEIHFLAHVLRRQYQGDHKLSISRITNVISVLMDCLFHFTVSLRKRLSLLTGTVENSPFLANTHSGRAETERDSTRTCMFGMDKQENI